MSTRQVVPRALKPITAFIRRAEEHDAKEGDEHRIISYYCREYAAELGFKLVQRNGTSSPEVDTYLGGVIDRLLSEKEDIKSLGSKEEAKVGKMKCSRRAGARKEARVMSRLAFFAV